MGGPARRPLAERLWERVAIGGPDDCWPWTGARLPAGYGTLSTGGHQGRHVYAHRVAYEDAVGPIPDGLTIDHLCRNPPCCNPAHLEAVTERVNLLRGNGWSGRKARQTHCIHGHPFDATNTYHWRGHRLCRACRAATSAERKRA